MAKLEARHLRSKVSALLVTSILVLVSAPSLRAQVTSDDADTSVTDFTKRNAGDFKFQPIRTDSPRETFATFLRLRDELEHAMLRSRGDRTRRNWQRLDTLSGQFIALLDLSSVPEGVREGIGEHTVAFLLDVFGRIDLPNPDDVPDLESMAEESAPTTWRIPGTPIRIARIAEGPREGEFLFSGGTIQVAPRMYQAIERVPLRSSLGIESWSGTLRGMTGPMIPVGVSSAIPNILHGLWRDTPIWKALATIALFVLSALVIGFMHHALNRRESKNRTGFLLRRALTPLSVLVADPFIEHILDLEINVAGAFEEYADTVRTVVAYAAWVWLLWLIVMVIVERIIVLRKRPKGSIDEQLLRIVARALCIVGGVIIVGAGAQKVGLPLYSVVAGLGIGGLAVALAVRPTLENLIGGVMLYLDRPVRVGDFCSFGDQMGTVENIGIRSTQIRALDRTQISIPNSIFADMEIVNWAKCDQMLIHTTIGLRYETEPDQLRYVLAKLREMLHAHPRIDRDTVRVRLVGFGVSSLDVDIRVYVRTREWNDFYAIREDVFLRVSEIVAESGTSFAFPSQTLYVGRDGGLDKERGDAAKQKVKSWRSSGRLPFPGLPASKLEQLADTLDYPPRGSPDADSSKPRELEATEPLSAEPQSEDGEHGNEPKHR